MAVSQGAMPACALAIATILLAPNAAIAAPQAPALSSAHHVEASKLRYHNNGSYTAYFHVEYKRDHDGKRVQCRLAPPKTDLIPVGGNKTIDLSGTGWFVRNGSDSACLTEQGHIPLETEVWGRVRIFGGEGQSCRKSTKVIYTRAGGTMKYRSGGTTYNNNRCKVSSWP